MAERFTKKDAEKAFERLCELMGKRPAESYSDEGAWMLDHNSTYGGYVVHEVASSGDGHFGIYEPFGAHRRNARDFWQMVRDIAAAFEIEGN